MLPPDKTSSLPLKSNKVEFDHQSSEKSKSDTETSLIKTKVQTHFIPTPTAAEPSDHSDDDSSAFELDEQNLFLCVNEARKVVVISKSGEFDEFSLLNQRKKRVVVILRDLSSVPDENEDLKCRRDRLTTAQAIKEHLIPHKIFCYIIGIPGLFQDLQAIHAIKGCSPQMPFDTAYNQLLLGIIQAKIKRKKGKVIILSLDDKINLCPKELKAFCETVCMTEVFTLDLDTTNDELFQMNLEKLTQQICNFVYETMPGSERPLKTTESDIYNNNCLEGFKTMMVENGGDEETLDKNVNEFSDGGEVDLNFIMDLVLNTGNHLLPISNYLKKAHSFEMLTNEIFLSAWEEIVLPKSRSGDETVKCAEDISVAENNTEEEHIPTEFDVKTDGNVFDENANSEPVENVKEEDHDVQSLESLSLGDDTVSDHYNSANSNDNIDSDATKPPVRVRNRKKRRNVVSAHHPELDNRRSLLKLMSRSKSKSASSDSEDSLHLSMLFASRPKLFKIRVTADESRYPSAVFTKFPDMSKHSKSNDLTEANLYKGWIAVPTLDASDPPSRKNVVTLSSSVQTGPDLPCQNNSFMAKLKPKLKRAGDTMKRVLRPIGNLLSCESCTNPNHNPIRRSVQRPSRRRSQVYPGIMLRSEAFDQKDREYHVYIQ